jgi:nucleoid-associated protein YgaU
LAIETDVIGRRQARIKPRNSGNTETASLANNNAMPTVAKNPAPQAEDNPAPFVKPAKEVAKLPEPAVSGVEASKEPKVELPKMPVSKVAAEPRSVDSYKDSSKMRAATGGLGGKGMRPDYITVKPGDTLVTLARKYYGDGRHYKKIYNANRRQLLRGVWWIMPGQRLRLP